MSFRSRKQRRAAMKTRLINHIYIDRCSSEHIDFLWVEFNCPTPSRDLRASMEAKPSGAKLDANRLSLFFKTDADKGEAYVSRNFPGITYRKSVRGWERLAADRQSLLACTKEAP